LPRRSAASSRRTGCRSKAEPARWRRSARSWYHPAPAATSFRRRRSEPHSSRGPGHRPLKAEITGSNPVCGTKLAISGPIHARIGPFACLRGGGGALIGALIALGTGRGVVAAAEDRVEAGHRRGLHRRQGVAVSVEGDGDLFVAQHLADDLGVGAGGQLEGGEGVAQVVEADRRQLGPAQQRLELQGRDVAAPERFARSVAEDEVVVGQGMADRQQSLGLPGPVDPEQIEGRAGEVDRAPTLGRLRLAEPPATVQPDQGVMDRHAPPGPVHVAPAQGQQLALAHAGREREGEKGLERVAADRLQEAAGLRWRQGPHLRRRHARQTGAGGWVALDEPPGDGLFERTVEDRVHVAERRRRHGAQGRLAGSGVRGGYRAWCSQRRVRRSDLLGGQRAQRDGAHGRDQVAADDAAISLEALRTELDRGHVGQPAFEQVLDRQPRVIDEAEGRTPQRLIAPGRRLSGTRPARLGRGHRPPPPVGVDVASTPFAHRRHPVRLLPAALVASDRWHGGNDDTAHHASSRAWR
jgi:hypothetical protein